VQETAEDSELAEAGGDGSATARSAAGQVLEGDLVRAVTSWFAGTTDRAEAPVDADERAEEELEAELFGPLPQGLRTRDVMQLSLDRGAERDHPLPVGRLPARPADHGAARRVSHARLSTGRTR
jgi:hypothetical protein